MRELDRIDGEILAALQKNARLSNKELAARLHIAQSTCLERVRRMVEEGVLRGFHARLDPEAVGIGLQALVSVRLTRHSRELVEAFRAHALAVPEVVALYHVGGADDFLLHVAVRDTEHLRELALTAFTERPEVAHMETALVFEHVGKAALPIYAAAGE
ncbi:MAG TPA: ArsR family transcriptional regulator [Acidobacteria bacterium]|nr:ArsR family transcriptional regulator [Acidobacteriota bacterium]